MSEEDKTKIRAKSRRYKLIKLFAVLIVINALYVMIMIPVMGDKFSPFITYFLTVSTVLGGSIGTWIGFVSAKQKD